MSIVILSESAAADERRISLQVPGHHARLREQGFRQTMIVTINGERREIPENLTVAGLLEHLGMPESRVAIERNLDILPRARWPETRVQPNDTFEIVQFVGGG